MGYDCAGHNMSITCPCLALVAPSLSATLILGATLPTGSNTDNKSLLKIMYE